MIFCVPFGSKLNSARRLWASSSPNTSSININGASPRALFSTCACANFMDSANDRCCPSLAKLVASRSFKNIATSSRCGPSAVERTRASSSRMASNDSNNAPSCRMNSMRVFSSPSLKCACAAETCGFSASHNSARRCHKTAAKPSITRANASACFHAITASRFKT